MRNPQVQPFTLVVGVPFGGLHVATAFSLLVNTPMIYCHSSAGKKEGEIEGNIVTGQSCLIIDDLITGGGSILETSSSLLKSGLIVRDAVTLADRQEGGMEVLREEGINLVSILTLEQIANHLRYSERISRSQFEEVLVYLSRSKRTT